MAENSLMT